jgi:hypothetical protein
MGRVIHLDKGSKKRIQRIRWTCTQRMTLALLFLVLGVFCILVGLWDAFHYVLDPAVSRGSFR